MGAGLHPATGRGNGGPEWQKRLQRGARSGRLTKPPTTRGKPSGTGSWGTGVAQHQGLFQ